jgi:hypothetical protein
MFVALFGLMSRDGRDAPNASSKRRVVAAQKIGAVCGLAFAAWILHQPEDGFEG